MTIKYYATRITKAVGLGVKYPALSRGTAWLTAVVLWCCGAGSIPGPGTDMLLRGEKKEGVGQYAQYFFCFKNIF